MNLLSGGGGGGGGLQGVCSSPPPPPPPPPPVQLFTGTAQFMISFVIANVCMPYYPVEYTQAIWSIPRSRYFSFHQQRIPLICYSNPSTSRNLKRAGDMSLHFCCYILPVTFGWSHTTVAIVKCLPLK